ncbi:L7Ae/L30e/S12e/Gadd45 family ribosomal protein [Pectinatus brassicae]|uniref:Ribosomal protein L7Ae-like RNA K-turn-binding protein n=1 Tax=Pectinatus brassicae TaxID=862415 RepID=A0A840UFN7_9FIRM|nr:ribosomal L7Ae/L30e/S12e/Gadd45 family protein [Pectinatus brassicae]MBB5335916.1 ribosomal protein L7Ae-like RNA K-turn-binding protein [Pectinatus brassicae]
MDNVQQKLMNLLSMAARANKLMAGDFAVSKAIENNKIQLLLIACDTAEKSKKEYEKIALSAGVALKIIPIEKQLLGNNIGKTERAAIAICDRGFAKAITKILDDIS